MPIGPNRMHATLTRELCPDWDGEIPAVHPREKTPFANRDFARSLDRVNSSDVTEILCIPFSSHVPASDRGIRAHPTTWFVACLWLFPYQWAMKT